MRQIRTKTDFQNFVASIESTPGYQVADAFGLWRVDRGADHNKILAVRFPFLNFGHHSDIAAVFQFAAGLTRVDIAHPDVSDQSEIVVPITQDFLRVTREIFAPFKDEALGDKHRNVQAVLEIDKQIRDNDSKLEDFYLVLSYDKCAAPRSVAMVYMYLYAQSLGFAGVGELNFDGMSDLLENLAWVNGKPVELADLQRREMAMKFAGTFPDIESTDQYPPYLGHIVRKNVRILDKGCVRLGAYLGAGTVVMRNAFVDWDVCIKGDSIIEGSLASAIIGSGTHIARGASIQGERRGGVTLPITIGDKSFVDVNALVRKSIGDNTTIGPQAVVDIALGRNCIVDGGLTVGRQTLVAMSRASRKNLIAKNQQLEFLDMQERKRGEISVCAAGDLVGYDDLHFSVSGSRAAPIAVARSHSTRQPT